ncbi:unnamed protein product, partial [Hapterophycus canaliculatus]
MTKYHSYVSLVNRCRRSISGQLRVVAGEGSSDIPTFGGFHDRQGFNGAWPSDAYLRSVWHKWFYDTPVIKADGIRMTRQDYLQRVGQLVDGTILAGDASFKYAKVIRLTSAEQSSTSKPIQGIFTIMNEYEQASCVVFQKAMKTGSVHDLKNDLKNLFVNRYLGHGFKLPVILFSDECCEDRSMFAAMFREIEEETGVRLFDATDTDATAGGVELEALALPEGKAGRVVWDSKAINLAVADLLQGCAAQGNVLGMDCEWEPPFNGSSESAVCTLQLALPDGTSYLFHLKRGARGTTPSTFNGNLKRLLSDGNITKVGVAVKGDGKRLERDYGVETCGMVDLRSYARACWVDLPCRSLAGMTATALGKSLSKDPAIRFSRWSTPELTPRQIEYACLDAYAAVLLHAEIGKFKDPIFSEAPSEAPPAGTEVAPASLVPHNDAPKSPDGQRRLSVKDVNSGDGFVLWDLVHVRLASAHRPFQGAPLPGGGADPDAYEDDFFDVPRPVQAVYRNDGDVESDLGEDDDSSDDDTLDENGGGADVSSAGSSGGGGPSASGPAGDSQERPGQTFAVRLDLFHALNRLSRTMKKRHGAFNPFMARLRDACFLVNREDVELALKARGMEDEHVQQIKDQNWSFFLKRCRRLVPPSNELLKRFDKVIEEFGNCVDNVSKEVLLRPKSLKAVDLLRKHIVAGCLSDPEGVAMYYAVGKTKDGLPDYRCVRGTNDVEGYHRYLRTLLACYCASPALAHSVLLEFNFRWNVKMMVKNRGLPESLGGHYNQYLVELIQRATADWDPSCPVFPQWPAAIDSVDTGERSGLAKSWWGGEGETALDSAGGEE